MAVITISRQYGSGGDEIAERICRMTGYRLFSKHIMARMAAEVGLTDEEVIDYSEENYKVQSFFDRLMGRQKSLPPVRIWKENSMGIRLPEEIQLTESSALALVQKAILTAGREGDLVVVGRGGQMVLKDFSDAVHVRIEAPLEERILRLRGQNALGNRAFHDSVAARRAYQDLIENYDRASANYLQTYYQVNWSDPSLYHLVINTSRLSIEMATDLVLALARKLEPCPVGV